MPEENLVASIRAGAADQGHGRVRAGVAGQRQGPGERDAGRHAGKNDLLLAIGKRRAGSLRAGNILHPSDPPQFERVGAAFLPPDSHQGASVRGELPGIFHADARAVQPQDFLFPLDLAQRDHRPGLIRSVQDPHESGRRLLQIEHNPLRGGRRREAALPDSARGKRRPAPEKSEKLQDRSLDQSWRQMSPALRAFSFGRKSVPQVSTGGFSPFNTGSRPKRTYLRHSPAKA